MSFDDDLLENINSTDEYIKTCESYIDRIDKMICLNLYCDKNLNKNKLKIKYLLKIYYKLCSEFYQEQNKNNENHKSLLLKLSINSSTRQSLIKQPYHHQDKIIEITEKLVSLYKKQKDYYSCGKLYEDLKFYIYDKNILLDYLIKSSFYYKKIKSKFFYKLSIYSILDILQQQKEYKMMSEFLEELYQECPSEHILKLLLISSKLHSSILYLEFVNKYQFNEQYPKNLFISLDKLQIIKNVHYNKWTNFFD